MYNKIAIKSKSLSYLTLQSDCFSLVSIISYPSNMAWVTCFCPDYVLSAVDSVLEESGEETFEGQMLYL